MLLPVEEKLDTTEEDKCLANKDAFCFDIPVVDGFDLRVLFEIRFRLFFLF